MIQEQFYSELGKYLYAIAMADGIIQDNEIRKVERIVSHELQLMKSEKNIRYKEVILTKLNFYNCLRDRADINNAKNSFLNFIKKNEGKIDAHEQEVAGKLIRKVATAWKGKNKTEEILVRKAEKYLSVK